MCGHSEAMIDRVTVKMEFGYLGGMLKIGDMAYSHSESPWYEGYERDPEMVLKVLAPYSKEQIVALLVDLVNNATEG